MHTDRLEMTIEWVRASLSSIIDGCCGVSHHSECGSGVLSCGLGLTLHPKQDCQMSLMWRLASRKKKCRMKVAADWSSPFSIEPNHRLTYSVTRRVKLELNGFCRTASSVPMLLTQHLLSQLTSLPTVPKWQWNFQCWLRSSCLTLKCLVFCDYIPDQRRRSFSFVENCTSTDYFRLLPQ